MNTREKADLPASIWRRPVRKRLAGLQSGQLEILEAGQRVVLGASMCSPQGQGDTDNPPLATFEVLDSACWQAIATGGALGAAESFMDGHWRSPDLAGLLRLMLRDQDVLEGLDGPLSALGAIPRWIGHALRRNTRSGFPAQHFSALRRRERFLPVVPRSDDVVFLCFFPVRGHKPGRGLDSQTGPPVRNAATQTGPAGAGDRKRLGRLRHSHGPAIRLQGGEHHDFQTAAWRGGSAGQGGGPSRPGGDPDAGLPGHRGTIRPADIH